VGLRWRRGSKQTSVGLTREPRLFRWRFAPQGTRHCCFCREGSLLPSKGCACVFGRRLRRVFLCADDLRVLCAVAAAARLARPPLLSQDSTPKEVARKLSSRVFLWPHGRGGRRRRLKAQSSGTPCGRPPAAGLAAQRLAQRLLLPPHLQHTVIAQPPVAVAEDLLHVLLHAG